MSQPEEPDGELRELLSALRIDPPDGGFEAGLSARLRQQRARATATGARGWPGRRRRPWVVGSLAGATAGALTFLLLARLSGYGGADSGTPVATPVATTAGTGPAAAGTAAPPDATPTGQAGAGDETPAPACTPTIASRSEVVVLPAGKVALVRLHFEVPRDVGEAEFSVLLPGGLSFFSDGQPLPDRTFHWVAGLSEGDNEIPVAVIANDPGQHRLTATATIDGEVVIHEVIFDVQEAV